MPLKLKLPERKESKNPTRTHITVFEEGFNRCLDEVQSLNPEMEIDVEGLSSLIEESGYEAIRKRYSGSMFGFFVANHIKDNAPRWLKEKG